MKKLLFCTVITFSSFAYAQVAVTLENADLNEVYQGGKDKMVHDLENNFKNFSAEYQTNGKFILTFDLDDNGKIVHPKVQPDVDHDFSNSLIRAFKRVKKNFVEHQPKQNMAVLFNFSQNFETSEGRERFSSPMPRER